MQELLNDWKTNRIGVFTASNVHKLLISNRSGKGFGKTALDYINEVVAELLTGKSENETYSKAIEWGCATEADAMAAYIDKTKKSVEYFGKENPVFFKIEDLPAGASPDGLIKDERIVEAKCPYNSANHIENMSLTAESFKTERKEYYAQIQLCMYATGVKLADFVSFDPRILSDENKLFILEIPYNEEFVNNLLERIKEASELLKSIYKSITHK